MKDKLKDYFTFNRKERNGIIVLLSIILALILSIQLVNFYHPFQPSDFTEFEKEILAFREAQQQLPAQESRKEKDSEIQPVQLFPFDPNKLPAGEWKKLGLKDWQIRQIHKYEAKGGKFYKKEDVARLYCLDSTGYARLEPYIRIAEQHDLAKSGNHADSSKTKAGAWSDDDVKIELNSAYTEDLKQLRGIGNVYGNLIVSYRLRLGGYHSLDQLFEIKALDEELVRSILDNMTLDSTAVRKININTCTIHELKRHPYLDSEMSKSIINHRETHGEFERPEDLLKYDLLNEELYSKIAPYLGLR